jgi:formylglycine-generating enzyme
MNRFAKLLAWCLVSLAAGGAGACSAGDTSDPRHLEVGETSLPLPKGTPGAVNGDLDYCTGGQVCLPGEGDCDADSECGAGTVCGYDNGPNFGFPSGYDACAPASCRNGITDAGESGPDCGGTSQCGACPTVTCPVFPNGDPSHCSTTCRCPAKEADCDSNAECQTGLVCATGQGPRFGFPSGHDVCVASHCASGTQDADETGVDCGGADCGTCIVCPPNGQGATCSPTCRCVSGWGDCDSNSECQTGLICGNKNGPKFGMHSSFDVCIPPHCQNGQQDGAQGETAVDCGGPCGGGTCGGSSTTPTSCAGGLTVCGSGGTENCCANLQVPAVTNYVRNYDGVTLTDPTNKQATVSAFFLDKFEVSVGRFRNFVAAYDAWRGAGNPAAGAGAHPLIAGSGWNATWPLAANAAALTTGLNCSATQQTWSDAPGTKEGFPINCMTWYEAFAFCLWDNGRLPTEAEWNAAAAGGTEQRVFPWSVPPTSTSIDGTRAIYSGEALARVGTKTAGVGRWGHLDLAGSMWEFNLDFFGTLPSPCTNCANLTNAAQRVLHGGSWQTFTTNNLAAGFRTTASQTARLIHVGQRCARQ